MTQFCGPVSQDYAGDQNGARYAELLRSFGMDGSTASAVQLGQTICAKRRAGAPGDGLIAWLQSRSGLSFAAATNTVGYGMIHFCPNLFDLN